MKMTTTTTTMIAATTTIATTTPAVVGTGKVDKPDLLDAVLPTDKHLLM